MQWSDQLELEDGGYAKFRISVNQDESTLASVYVQGWPRIVEPDEWEKAAWGLFGAHTGLRIYQPDGTPVTG